MINKKRSRTLKKKLGWMSGVIIAPLLIISIILVGYMRKVTNAFNEVTVSVAYANEYSQEFKERIDYSAYYAVIGGLTMDKLGHGEHTVNGIEIVNPYVYINELKNACDEMGEIATVDKNKYAIKRVKKSLESLRKCVQELDNSIRQGGNYDINIQMLSDDIYTLTAVIQGGIQDYVYLETANFANVRAEMLKQNSEIIRICIIMIVIVVLLAIILAGKISNSITEPIEKLCKFTERVASGDFSAQINIKNENNEISVLSNSFNAMIVEIGTLVEDIKKEQEILYMTETKLLQAQINPHFLYNTLDTIVWLAEEQQTREVVSMVTELSNFFRTTLSEGKDCITIREEQSHIKSYLEIQQFRYQDIMEYNIDIDDGIYEYGIPKLTLQPLVENALYHGVKLKRGLGHIEIRGYEQGGDIVFRIQDDGIGMSKDELKRLRGNVIRTNREEEARGFGLRNVNTRAHYYYGNDYGLSIESEKGKGTTVTIRIGKKSVRDMTAQ